MIKETDEDGNTKYTYVKCPACKSKKRHYEDASNKAVKMGVAPAGFLEAFTYNSRAIADPVKLNALKPGEEAPLMVSALEICKGCGCVYAPMVISGKVKKTLTTGVEQAKKDGKPSELFSVDGKKIL